MLKDAFTAITCLDSLLSAHKQALRGKRANLYATSFDYDLMSNLLELQAELREERYVPQPYRKKIITEPKLRLIEAPAYRDRVVQHALHARLSSFYERFFIPTSFACRPKRGIHHAARKVQQYLRQGGPGLYVCQLDISKYYASINHGRLLELLTEKIADPEVLRLLEIIINSTDSGAEHDGLFAPDSPYFTKGRRGIPIGNLTSQLFANVYLHRADSYAKQTLKIRGYIRYMDDILFFHHDKAQLHAWKEAMITFLHDDLFLTANPRKTRLYPTKHGVDFVGYVIYPQAMRLRGSSVRRFKKRYRKQLESVMNGRTDPEVMRQSFNSWKAHAAHAKSEKLVEKLEGLQDDALFVRQVLYIYHKRQKEAARAPRQLSLFDRE